ncbi:DUF302 domain-containing protein, partial [uncultured Caballeronia sp.]|uniref:DUF302 domain-containing protein n=1 Tax=uncultured Caballeronia sp. TaxID=1827198 RepID=UPI0035CC0050
IDQSAAAEQSGLHLRPTRPILFGNPKAGTPVMQANPYAALELPLRLLIWESETSKVSVSFLDPVDALQTQYGLDAQIIKPLAQARGIVQGALSRP